MTIIYLFYVRIYEQKSKVSPDEPDELDDEEMKKAFILRFPICIRNISSSFFIVKIKRFACIIEIIPIFSNEFVICTVRHGEEARRSNPEN